MERVEDHAKKPASRRAFALLLAGAAGLLVALPLAGALSAGRPIADIFIFPLPPRTRPLPPFSWPVFVVMALGLAAVLFPFLRRLIGFRTDRRNHPMDAPVTAVGLNGGARVGPTRTTGEAGVSDRVRLRLHQMEQSTRRGDPDSSSYSSSSSYSDESRTKDEDERTIGLSIPDQAVFAPCPLVPRPFPWWGWLGLGLGAAAWWLAWTRQAWFAPFQAYTFAPLWIPFMLVFGAWTVKRGGRCLLAESPRRFLSLFPASALFWWFFEYLNRFAQNWQYEGVGLFTPTSYAIHATICFSTVLPAFRCAEEWLATFPAVWRKLENAWRAPAGGARTGFAAMAIACLGLLAVGGLPDMTYPLLWIAPFLLLIGAQWIAGRPTVFDPAARGDWSGIARAAVAALLCGFFWELWNEYSLAKWIYTVPYVGRFHVFEMPVLGFAGYLPFGLECASIIALFGRIIHPDFILSSKQDPAGRQL